jgi:hypothetical protein
VSSSGGSYVVTVSLVTTPKVTQAESVYASDVATTTGPLAPLPGISATAQRAGNTLYARKGAQVLTLTVQGVPGDVARTSSPSAYDAFYGVVLNKLGASVVTGLSGEPLS